MTNYELIEDSLGALHLDRTNFHGDREQRLVKAAQLLLHRGESDPGQKVTCSAYVIRLRCAPSLCYNRVPDRPPTLCCSGALKTGHKKIDTFERYLDMSCERFTLRL